MGQPREDVQWAEDASADVAEPSLGQKIVGWITGTRPPAEWMNWFQRSSGRHTRALARAQINGLTPPQNFWGSTQRIFDVATNGRGVYVFALETGGTDVSIGYGISSLGFAYASTVPAKAKDIYAICWSEALSLFVAVGESDVTDRLWLTSPDGDVWTEQAVGGGVETLLDVKANADVVLACGYGDGGFSGRVMVSTDGISVASSYTFTTPAFVPYTMAYSPTLDLWVIAGAIGADAIDPNQPAVWTMPGDASAVPTQRTLPAMEGSVPNHAVDIVWAGDRFIIITATGQTAYSLNGTAWVAGHVLAPIVGAGLSTEGHAMSIAADPNSPSSQCYAVRQSDTHPDGSVSGTVGNGEGYALRTIDGGAESEFGFVRMVEWAQSNRPCRLKYLTETREYVLIGQRFSDSHPCFSYSFIKS